MKRNVTIAAITAAVLVGGTTAATVAFADSDGDRDRTPARSAGTVNLADASASASASDDRRDDASDDRTDAPAAAKDTRITLDQAVAAALRSTPGTVTEAGLDRDDDDHGGRTVWELDVRGSDKKWYDVTVDAASGKVLTAHEDRNDDRRDSGSFAVSLKQAAEAALKTAPGSVTAIDLDTRGDDDDSRRGAPHWDVDIAGKDGKQHELHVDAKTGKVTADRDDDADDRDDRAEDRDDRDDDRDGDDD
ncbi:PepSY domain-containing protein [Streptomyces sp. NPDC101181]|uniref:PepSY domain-containing protein n=1 Tax=Streptomyces sp. NPDC101181 TaxID=3366125 RepID=UPI0037F7FBBB